MTRPQKGEGLAVTSAERESKGGAMIPSTIEVILYDLGNVILPFNHYPIAEQLARFSCQQRFQDPHSIFSYLFDFEKGAINGYETGKVSSVQFFQSLKESLQLSLSFEAFVPIWNEIFIEDPEVSETIRFQKRRWRLGLLSNTNPLHFDYILSNFPIVRAFDRWILSHEVGFKKPEIEIFQKAMEWAGTEPRRILFIDDQRKNVDAAISLGMQGVHFASAQQLRELFRATRSLTPYNAPDPYRGKTGVG